MQGWGSKTRTVNHPRTCNSRFHSWGWSSKGRRRVSRASRSQSPPRGAAPERSDCRAAMPEAQSPHTGNREVSRLSLSFSSTTSCPWLATSWATPTSAGWGGDRHFPASPHLPLGASCPQNPYIYPKCGEIIAE